MSFPLKIVLGMGRSGPLLIHGSLGPPESKFQTGSRSVDSVQPFFAQLMAENRDTLQWADPFPLIIAASHGVI